MGPVPNGKPSKKLPNDDYENYEQDGWEIGFEVQMNGVGIFNVAEGIEESDSEGYEGPGDSDGEDEIRRAGYEAVPFNCESDGGENSDGEEHNNIPVNSEKNFEEGKKPENPNEQVGTQMVDNLVHSEFQLALSSARDIHLKDCDFNVSNKAKEFTLTDDKVEQIRNAMSNFSLPPPPNWSNVELDSKLVSLLKKQ